MSIIEKSIKAVASDKFELFASISDGILNETPFVGTINKIAKLYNNSQNCLLERKLISALQEIKTVDPVLLQGAIENLREELGIEYSDDVFIDAVFSANSAEMSKIPGKVFKAFCEKKITIEQYWSLLNITKTLIYPDVKCALNSENAHIHELGISIQQRLQSVGLAHSLQGYGVGGVDWNFALLNALVLALTGDTARLHKPHPIQPAP